MELAIVKLQRRFAIDAGVKINALTRVFGRSKNDFAALDITRIEVDSTPERTGRPVTVVFLDPLRRQFDVSKLFRGG